MSFNLLRNSRVFFTTNVGTSGSTLGVVAATGFTADNTREIQVLDGFGFSQNTTSETVTLNETGASPVRGQRSFNTQLDPVDFNMTTYIRPVDDGTIVTAEESVLWNALFGTAAISTTAGTLASGAAWKNVATGSSPAVCVATNSNAHQLQRFGLIIIIDTACFVIDDCVLNTATIDFGIDAIASIQWAGQAKAIRRITAPTFADSNTWSGSLAGDFKNKITAAAFIANKLSVLTLRKGIGGTSGNYYNLPLTGGNLTISNNISYLTPATLGIVNQPATYFTGTRAISGSLTAYLRSGSASGANDTANDSTGRKQTAQLLGDLLDDSTTDVDPAFYLKIAIGGSSAVDRVELEMPGVVLTIPTIATEQVISTTINFTAQASASNEFDLSQTNELTVNYYA
jgi:acyl-coenzyme A thioesterase PaaI-like protein